MGTSVRSTFLCMLALVVAVALVGCPPPSFDPPDSEPDDPPDGEPGDGKAQVQVLLTAGENKVASAILQALRPVEKSNPVDVDSIESLMITVTEINLDRVGGPQETVYSGAKDVDVMNLRGVSELLSVAEVPAGDYTKIRLSYENPRLRFSDDDDDHEYTDIHRTANGRLFVSEKFTLVEDETNRIVLDFYDLHLVRTPPHGDGFVFTPQLRADVRMDEDNAVAEGFITELDEEDGWFELELRTLTLPNGSVNTPNAAPEYIDVHYSPETTEVFHIDDPATDLGVDHLELGMPVEVDGVLYPDGSMSAFVIWDIEVVREGIIADLYIESQWFTLVLDDDEIDVAFDQDTPVLLADGEDVNGYDIGALADVERVQVIGAFWRDETISAFEIWILEFLEQAPPEEEEEEDNGEQDENNGD